MSYFKLEDNGIRCLKAPCFSWNIQDINSGDKNQVSRLDFSNFSFKEKEIEKDSIARCYSQLNIVEGSIEGTRDSQGLSDVTLYIFRFLDT